MNNYPCLCLCLGFSQITAILPFLLIHLHLSHIGFTDDLTFIFFSFINSLYVRFYFNLKVIRPLDKSYGVISTLTLSPGKILMKFFLILPEMCAKISWSFSSFTRNIAFGIDSIIVPSNSITSFAIFSSFSAL